MTRESICDALHIIGDGLCPNRYIRAEIHTLPDYTNILTKDEVSEIVSNTKRKYWQRIDKEYKEVSMESMKLFLNIDTVSERPYIPQEHDCDNFAIELAGHVSEWAKNVPFGLAFLNGHVINCFICDKKIYFVEPQTDEIFTGLDPEYTLNFLVL